MGKAVAPMMKMIIGKLEERDLLDDLGIDGRVMALRNDCEDVNWIYLTQGSVQREFFC
jgi:hypothetical protein